MKASDILMTLTGAPLEVRKAPSGRIMVMYADGCVKGAGVLIYVFGAGSSFEDACEEYLKQIRGKVLVLHPGTKQRREIQVAPAI